MQMSIILRMQKLSVCAFIDINVMFVSGRKCVHVKIRLKSVVSCSWILNHQWIGPILITINKSRVTKCSGSSSTKLYPVGRIYWDENRDWNWSVHWFNYVWASLRLMLAAMFLSNEWLSRHSTSDLIALCSRLRGLFCHIAWNGRTNLSRVLFVKCRMRCLELCSIALIMSYVPWLYLPNKFFIELCWFDSLVWTNEIELGEWLRFMRLT